MTWPKKMFRPLVRRYEIIEGKELNIFSGLVPHKRFKNEKALDISRIIGVDYIQNTLKHSSTVTFKSSSMPGGEPYIWENVKHASVVKKFVNQLQEDPSVFFEVFDKSQEENDELDTPVIEDKAITTPEHLPFSDNVLTLAVDSEEWRWLGALDSNKPEFKWINRGEPIFTAHIKTSFFKSETVSIKSPVSGLLINRYLSYNPNHPKTLFVILMPDGEPSPAPVYNILESFFACWSENREYLARDSDFFSERKISIDDRNPKRKRISV